MTEQSRGERLVAVDVFRGITIAGMLLVNNPGTWSHIYPPLRHAEWHGWTPTDLIFPFFLFIVGITTHISLQAKRARGVPESELILQIIRRGSVIFLLGLMLNAFPFYMWGTIEGNPNPSVFDRVVERFAYLRIPGVLQRIGVAYIFAALLTLRTTVRQQVAIVTALLVGYWIAMTLIPVPGSNGVLGGALLDRPSEVLSAWVDRAVIGVDHLWRASKTWDPEGILSTIPAIGTSMLGVLTGRWITRTHGSRNDLLAPMFAVGSLVMVAGLIWNWVFPINKALWTSSYVLFTAGMGAVTLATLIWIIDVQGWQRWSVPFIAFGVNPILAFVGSGIMARTIGSLIKIGDTSFHTLMYRTAFASWLPPKLASLTFAIAFVLVWLAILWPLYRKRMYLRV